MKRHSRLFRCAGLVAVLSASASGQRLDLTAPVASVEDIYIARSLRESRVPPTDWCLRPRVGFTSVKYEDRYALRAVETRASDGLVVNGVAHEIGNLHACFGSTTDSAVSNFYAEGTLSGVAVVGRGECSRVRQEFPEPGITIIRCFLDLRDLPAPYLGGLLTTNTINSRTLIGEQSDPPGYVQPSIATIRLWKRR